MQLHFYSCCVLCVCGEVNSAFFRLDGTNVLAPVCCRDRIWGHTGSQCEMAVDTQTV